MQPEVLYSCAAYLQQRVLTFTFPHRNCYPGSKGARNRRPTWRAILDCPKPSAFYLPTDILRREQFRIAQELLRTSEDRRIKEIKKFASDSADANSDAH